MRCFSPYSAAFPVSKSTQRRWWLLMHWVDFKIFQAAWWSSHGSSPRFSSSLSAKACSRPPTAWAPVRALRTPLRHWMMPRQAWVQTTLHRPRGRWSQPCASTNPTLPVWCKAVHQMERSLPGTSWSYWTVFAQIVRPTGQCFPTCQVLCHWCWVGMRTVPAWLARCAHTWVRWIVWTPRVAAPTTVPMTPMATRHSSPRS